jgi:AcrR family transcriptional regulator
MAKTAATDRQTKLKIFRAASDVFEEKGYDGARMQEIADKAGCCTIISAARISSLCQYSRCF